MRVLLDNGITANKLLFTGHFPQAGQVPEQVVLPFSNSLVSLPSRFRVGLAVCVCVGGGESGVAAIFRGST